MYPIVVADDSMVVTNPATPPADAAVDTTAIPATCVAAAEPATTDPIVAADAAATPAPGKATFVVAAIMRGAAPGANTVAAAPAPATVAPTAP